MSRIDFYHLQKHPLEEILPKLLLKAYQTGAKICLRTNNEDRISYLNELLWTFQDDAFIPHGSKKDGFSEQQPIFITCDNESPNNAELLFIIDDADFSDDDVKKYNRIFNIFNGENINSVNKSRELWKKYNNSVEEIHYWKQSETGSWLQAR